MMMKLASSAALLVAGVEANKFYKPNLRNDYALGEELAKNADIDVMEGAYCAYTVGEKQGLTPNTATACDMEHGGCNAPIYVLPAGETKDCCKKDQEMIYKAVSHEKDNKEQEFTSLSSALSWQTKAHKDAKRSPTIRMSSDKIFGTAMYNAVVQDVSVMKSLLNRFAMTHFEVKTGELKVADSRYSVLKASFTNSNGESMKTVLDSLQQLLTDSCLAAIQGGSGIEWRANGGAGIVVPAVGDCNLIAATVSDIDVHKLMGASGNTIIAPCRKSFAQLSKRERPTGGRNPALGAANQGVMRFGNAGARNQRKSVHAGALPVGDKPLGMAFWLPTSASDAACPGAGDAETCAFSNISATTNFAPAATFGGMMVNGHAAYGDHVAAVVGGPAPVPAHATPRTYFVSQTTYWVTKSGVKLETSVAFAEAAQQAYNDLYWPECCCGISTCCCFATWMAIGGTLFVTISAAVAMMMCGFCDESEDSTYTETNAGASTEAKADAPATESKPEVAEPEPESKGCNCCLIVIIAVVAVVVIVGLVYCCSGSNKSEMEEESDEEEQP